MRAPSLLLLAVLLLAPGLAAAYPDPDAAPRYHDSPCRTEYDRSFVYDYLQVVEPGHAAEVEGAACEVYVSTHAHFVLVAVPDTEGEILENYALNLFETWGVGQEEVNDGLMLLYVGDYSAQGGGGAVRVEVGYGLEHVVNARVSMDAVRAMQDAKARALDAGKPESEATSFALAAGAALVLNTLADGYVDGSFPERVSSEPPWWFYLLLFLALFFIVWVLSAAADRGSLPGPYAGRHRHGPGTGGGGLGGGGFRGGGGGGGFGGGRSGGGGGGGRL